MKIAVLSRSAGWHAKHNVVEILKELGAEYYTWSLRAKAKNADIIYLVGWYISGIASFQQHYELLKWGKPVIIHWAGTDVMLVDKYMKEEAGSEDVIGPLCSDNVTHLCQTDALGREVKQLGIHQDITTCPIASRLDLKPEPFSTDMSGKVMPQCTTYIPPGRADFYHFNLVHEVALLCPDVNFIITSMTSPQGQRLIADNLADFGKLSSKQMTHVIYDSNMHLRLVPHDGMSLSVVEHGLAGRRILYSLDHLHTIKVPLEAKAIAESIGEIKDLPEPDYEAAEYFKRNFGQEQYRNKVEEICNGVT